MTPQAPTASSLSGFVDRIRGPPKTVTVYGAEPDDEFRSFLERFDVSVVNRSLPVSESAGYLTVREGEEFVGSLAADRFGEVVDPAKGAPWSSETRGSAFRDLARMLTGASFTATDRATLLATSREFEDRAWRVGAGRLDAGFQSLSVYRTQIPVYRRLATETALAVTVYGQPDWISDDMGGVSVRAESDTELGKFWFVAFDGGGNEEMACALVAEETAPGKFEGVWTYEYDVTRDLLDYLDDRYGPRERNG